MHHDKHSILPKTNFKDEARTVGLVYQEFGTKFHWNGIVHSGQEAHDNVDLQ